MNLIKINRKRKLLKWMSILSCVFDRLDEKRHIERIKCTKFMWNRLCYRNNFCKQITYIFKMLISSESCIVNTKKCIWNDTDFSVLFWYNIMSFRKICFLMLSVKKESFSYSICFLIEKCIEFCRNAISSFKPKSLTLFCQKSNGIHI